ncbi:unnamed protein product, partial [Adineta steineri]
SSIVVSLMGDTLSDIIPILEHIGIILLMFLVIAIGCICILCGCGCCRLSDDLANSITPEQSQIEHREFRWQYIDDSRSRYLEINSPNTILSSVNSTDFVSQPSLQNAHNDISRTRITSHVQDNRRIPPTYDNTIQQTSAWNTIQQYSLPRLSHNLPEFYRIPVATPESQSIRSLLPSYDDIIQQNSVSITMQRQSELPPSYNDVMRERNERTFI